MYKSMMLLWVTLSFFLFINTVAAQDELILDDEQEEIDDTACIPEDLSTPYDQFIGAENASSMIRQWYSFGSEHHKNKNYQSALPYLWKVFLNDSTKYGNLAIGKIADGYFQEQKIDSTLIACYKGLAKFSDQQKLHYFAGFLQKELGKAACAIPHYEALVEANPENKSYLSELAFLYYKNEDERSIDIQKKAVTLDPNDAAAKDALANYTTYFKGSALEAWKDAYKQDPNNLDAARNYGVSAVEEGIFEEALEPLSKAISVKAQSNDYKYRAMAYENLNRFNDAIADLNSWLAIDPDNADIMLSIAVDYSSLNQFSTANNWINKALRKKPGYGKAYIAKGENIVNTVLYCQDKRGKIDLEDKIAYEMALSMYKKAQNDVAFRSAAKTKYNNLKPFGRTSEDKFMHPNATLKSDCYNYLK